ncbi:MAG: cysteine--tRNA ligase [Ruminococcus sp.]|nr:cysteine--tRNA ligase [Candidatus Apopatosoma intestinale]
MKLYNTLGKQIEDFVPRDGNKVKLYTCGPTVYHFAHIGNLRSYLMEDVLEKFLRYAGYDVTRAMNITDVGHLTSDGDTGEDKMLKGAKREHKTVMEIAQFYTDAFFSDCDKLNIKKPEIVVPATSCIDTFIEMVQTLLDKGYAYLADGNVYFDTSKANDYYALSGHAADELMVGVRDDVEEDTSKKNKSDFVLWFTKSKFEDQELKWDSPWGVGYPGWHIECSGISGKYLGEYLDIHCGGVDNIFPHHTNEIAQSEAYFGHKWCNYWFHVQHLNDETGKMSKSKGEFLTVSLLEEKGYHPLAYRLFCLQSHYRKPLTFSFAALDGAEAAYNKLKKRALALKNDGEVDETALAGAREDFIEKMSMDLNTASALTLLFDTLKMDVNDATKRAIIADYDRVFSLDLLKEEEKKEETLPDNHDWIMGKIAERADAKKAKDYARADAIRAELAAMGITLVDTPQGTTYKLG